MDLLPLRSSRDSGRIVETQQPPVRVNTDGDAASRRGRWIAAGLLLTQAILIGTSLSRNALTKDEPQHLPVGLRYWDTGRFWAYHHNPPLTRLIYALPLIVTKVPRAHESYTYRLHQRWPDAEIAKDFKEQHGPHSMELFVRARAMGVLFAMLGGLVVYRWSRELWGPGGAVLSLALWAFSPWMIAHAGLVTPDIGVTVLMLAATYVFWCYLQVPSPERAVLSGIVLGLAQGAKFSAAVLVPVWLLLAVLRFAPRRHAWGPRPPLARLLADGAIVTTICLAVLNSIYGWEATGKRLGEFPLRSPSLTRALDQERVNRFRDTWLRALPVPLPEHYVLGFDDQLWDLEEDGRAKYLGGEVRRADQPGWWYYYLYGLAVKTPLGTLAAIGVAMLLLQFRRYRCSLVTELSLLLPVLAVIVSMSLKTGMNNHVRYVLPALPFLHIFAGRVAVWASSARWRQVVLCGVVLVGTAASVMRVHPHYLAYFNEAAGGPRGGVHHLVDSNLDWGQGLLALRDWLEQNAPRETVWLAYFGGSEPEHVGIDYRWLDPNDPHPGLHAVSATLLAGQPSYTFPLHGDPVSWRPHAFRGYQKLDPLAVPGYSIYVFKVTPAQARVLRR